MVADSGISMQAHDGSHKEGEEIGVRLGEPKLQGSSTEDVLHE